MAQMSQAEWNAFGGVILKALATSSDIDAGEKFTIENVRLTDTNTKLGNWEITVKRTKKP